MQYKVRTFVIPARINKVQEEVTFSPADGVDGVTITLTDVDGSNLQFRFDNTLFEEGSAGAVVLLPSGDIPSQAVRTERLFRAIVARTATSGLQMQVVKESDTVISLKQIQGGDVVSVALSNAIGGTIVEVVAGTNGIANPAYGTDLELTPSNLGFNPASSGMSKVQVSTLDFGGTFSLSFRPVGTSDYLPFADPVAGANADAGDDLILLGKVDDPVFDAVKIGFANTNGSDITVYATFLER